MPTSHDRAVPELDIALHYGPAASVVADDLIGLYRAAFFGPPWDEGEPDAAAFATRLAREMERPGFVVALARLDGRPVGFGMAWDTRPPFPEDRNYGRVAAMLGADRVASWLVGAQQIDELAVSPDARGYGVGGRLLSVLTGLDEGRGTWLLTSTRSPVAVPFYRKRDWRQITQPTGDGEELVVFLSPGHPQRPE